MDRLLAMKTFVRVVDEGSFVGAAKALNISPAAVSKHVAFLEAHLQVRLLHRTTRSMTITEEGAVHVDQCRRWLQELALMEDALRTRHQEPQGIIRITAPIVYGQIRVMPVILEFMKQYPQVHIQVLWSDEPFALVPEGIDLAVRIVDSLPDSSMIVQRLSQEYRMLYASPEYLETYGTPTSPEDLRDHRALLYRTATYNHVWHLGVEHQSILPDIPYFLETCDMASLLDATLGGLGIADLPEFMTTEHVKEGRLKPVLSKYSKREVNIWLLQPNRHYTTRRVVLLKEMLQDAIP